MMMTKQTRSAAGFATAVALALGIMTAAVLAAECAGAQVDIVPEGKISERAVLTLMNLPVDGDVFAAYKQTHPAPFWLFGEERRLAVRNNIMPRHWFEDGGPASVFRGTARPGEFFVFQACVASEQARELAWSVEKASSGNSPAFESSRITPEFCAVAANGVKPLWCGIQVPADVPEGNILKGSVTVRDRAGDARGALPFEIMVAGATLADGGVHDGWRLARLQWLDSRNGASDTEVTRPFAPVSYDSPTRTIRILGRELQLAPNGLPAQYISYFNGSNTRVTQTARAFLQKPVDFTLGEGGTSPENPLSFAITAQTPCFVAWRAETAAGTGGSAVRYTVEGKAHFDGFVEFKIHLSAATDAVTAEVEPVLTVRVVKDGAPYQMGLGRKGGLFPKAYDWKWAATNHQDAVWFGDVNVGMMIRLKGANYVRPLNLGYYKWLPLNLPESWGKDGGMTLSVAEVDGTSLVRAYSGKQRVTSEAPLCYAFDLHLTPFKPISLEQRLADRRCHYSQKTFIDRFKERKADRASIITLHHNSLANPYINYPYNDDGGPYLKKAVKQAHEIGLRIDVYYTARELTQNLPEFFALHSLDGEIFMPPDNSVKGWTPQNPKGPNAWLQKYAGNTVIPAWREEIRFDQYPHRLDLSVITRPDSRWNNFYLAGLDYLVKRYGIDGIYIDDTALNRETLQRARRILDADGKPRRIDMHSFNHNHSVCRRACSAVMYMELFPYFDTLWYGESFMPDTPPEYWLTEMSGIPYGLMGEMLARGGNVYRGMLLGMTQRLHGGDPRGLWEFFEKENLGAAELVGFWDRSSPVKVADNAEIKASVYRLPDRVFVAVANFSGDAQTGSLSIDWQALKMSAGKARASVPAIKKFQEGADSFDMNRPLTLPGAKGVLFMMRDV